MSLKHHYVIMKNLYDNDERERDFVTGLIYLEPGSDAASPYLQENLYIEEQCSELGRWRLDLHHEQHYGDHLDLLEDIFDDFTRSEWDGRILSKEQPPLPETPLPWSKYGRLDELKTQEQLIDWYEHFCEFYELTHSSADELLAELQEVEDHPFVPVLKLFLKMWSATE